MVSINTTLAALDEREIAQHVGIPHDEARIRFPLSSNTVRDFDEFREIIILSHFNDLSYREIAETLSIPEGTVMSRLYHARLSLKSNLQIELEKD